MIKCFHCEYELEQQDIEYGYCSLCRSKIDVDLLEEEEDEI